MDAPDHTLLHLYGEAAPLGQEPVFRPDPAEEAADRAALAEAKGWLDARPRVRPSADVLDAVLRAAAHGSPAGAHEPGVRYDRGPVRPARRLRRAWALVGATCALAAGGFFVTVGPSPRAEAPAPPAVASAPAAQVPAPLAYEVAAAPVALPALASVAAPTPAPIPVAEPVAAAPAAPAVRPEPSWRDADTDARVLAAEARTARLRARLDSTLWDVPALSAPLALPAPSSAGRFTTASSPKQ